MTRGKHVEDQEGDHGHSATETARYIAEHTEGLSKLARGAGLDVVTYLLDMARLEAEEAAQGKSVTKSN